MDATVDLGAEGKDNDSGYGKLVLPVQAPSPRITSVSPGRVRYNQVVTIGGSGFGSSRGSSSVRIGWAAVSSFTSWSNIRIQFRVPPNTRSGHLSVRTSEGISNALFLEVTSPYLSRVFPARVKPGDRLTLTGANFGSTRGNGYVLFAPDARPASGDYRTWSDRSIVVEVPSGAESGNVKVVTLSGSSGNRRIVVEGEEEVEPLPSSGIFGYDPPGLTRNPKSVRFGFEGIGEDVAMSWTLKNDSEIDVLVNGRHFLSVEESDDWKSWWSILYREDLQSGQNVIEFRNRANQDRSSSFSRWQLKDVRLWKPFGAKPVAGATFLGTAPVLETALGDPFPTPFNAGVTLPFTTADPGMVRLSVFNLMGQQVRVLQDGWTGAGEHRAHWNGRTESGTEAASGIYWALLEAGEIAQSTRLVLIR